MTLPALQPLEELLPSLDPLCRDLGLRRNLYGFARFFGLPARREGFDVGDQVVPVLCAEGQPGRHITSTYPSLQGVHQIGIQRERTRGGRSAFELGEREVARFGIDVRRVLTFSIPLNAVASNAITLVQSRPSLLLRRQVVLRDRITARDSGILGGSHTRCQHDSGHDAEKKWVVTGSHSFPLFSERKVESHEVAAHTLIFTAGCESLEVNSGEFLVPGQTVPAMHERIVAIPQGKDIGIAEIGGIARQCLPRDPGELIAANEEKLRRECVVGLYGTCIPDWTLRPGRKQSRVIRRSSVRKKNIVFCTLVYPGYVKFADIQGPINACSVKRSIASTCARYRYSAGSEKESWP